MELARRIGDMGNNLMKGVNRITLLRLPDTLIDTNLMTWSIKGVRYHISIYAHQTIGNKVVVKVGDRVF